MSTYETTEEKSRNERNYNQGNSNNNFWGTVGKMAAGAAIVAALVYKCGPEQNIIVDNCNTCPPTQTEKPYVPPKNQDKDSKKGKDKSDLEKRLDDNPKPGQKSDKTDDDCYKTIKTSISKYCDIPNPALIFVENGIEYGYRGSGSETVPKYNMWGKVKKHGKTTEDKPTHVFMSKDGQELQIFQEDIKNFEWDNIYKTSVVRCDDNNVTSEVTPDNTKNKRVRLHKNNVNRLQNNNYNGYNNSAYPRASVVSVAIAGNGGYFGFSSVNNPMMGFGPYMNGFSNRQMMNMEVNGQVYDQNYRNQAFNGQSVSVRNTTKPSEWQRAMDNEYRNRFGSTRINK